MESIVKYPIIIKKKCNRLRCLFYGEGTMSVTLKDLAKASGVSIGTVSRALNDKNEVSAKTSERIRQLAQELGYIPNRAGRALSSQKNINFIGICIPSINSPFFDDIKKGIDQALREFKDLVGIHDDEIEFKDGIEFDEETEDKFLKYYKMEINDAIVSQYCNILELTSTDFKYNNEGFRATYDLIRAE